MHSPGEVTYYQNIGEQGRVSSLNKPFSEEKCGAILMEVGAIFSLLPPPPAKVLDCGCGTGWLSYFLARKGYEVTGQDVAPDAIALARENPVFNQGNVPEFVVGDFDSLQFEDQFDAVIFFASLHHSLEEQATINSTYKALKKGGVLIASEPGKGHHQHSLGTIEKYDLASISMRIK